MFKIPYIDHIINKEVMKRAKIKPKFIEIHPSEKMLEIRPHGERSKILQTRKMGRPGKSWNGEVWELTTLDVPCGMQ